MPETRTNHACLACHDTAGTGLWLQNNAWGYEDAADPPQAVRAEPQRLSWRWDWPSRGGADDARVVAYPGVICGRKPFGGLASSTPRLPARLDAVARLDAAHDLRLRASGAYNAAFDLWLVRAPDAGEDGVVAEVMVWLAHQGLPPAGRWVETLATPHGPARFFAGVVRHWRCYTFVLDTPRLVGTADLGFFLRHLQATGRAEANLWLASVELGTEICHGRGRAELRGFQVGLVTGNDPGPSRPTG